MTHVYCVTSFLSDVCDCAKGSWRQHDFVFIYQRVFPDSAEDVTPRDMVTNLADSKSKLSLGDQELTLKFTGSKSHLI